MFSWHCFKQWLVAASLIAVLMPGGSVATHAAPQVAEPFREYYNKHQGMRVLGQPLTGLLQAGGYPAQYFEKGRIEDHSREIANPEWALMYGRLTAESISCDPYGDVDGTSRSYAGLQDAADPKHRVPAPAGFRGGTMPVADGTFVPFDARLRPAPGYVVPWYFWDYINRADLFPGGWLHDVGLPMTKADKSMAFDDRRGYHDIMLQGFERAVLTYDQQNPPDWRVERANIGSDAVRKLPQPRTPGIEVPTAGARVTLPLHILARTGRPCEQITATLLWQDGTRLSQVFTNRLGEDGRGLLIDSLDWPAEVAPPQTRTQQATLELRNRAGSLLNRQRVSVLSPKDPDTVEVKLYWMDRKTGYQSFNPEDWLVPESRAIPRTERIGTATLQELLWGPGPRSPHFGTSIPLPKEVHDRRDYYPDWGPRVRLRKLVIENGVATPDFSREINAYGGGSARVAGISMQIIKTLEQFPTVNKVVIAVEGETEGVLQP